MSKTTFDPLPENDIMIDCEILISTRPPRLGSGLDPMAKEEEEEEDIPKQNTMSINDWCIHILRWPIENMCKDVGRYFQVSEGGQVVVESMDWDSGASMTMIIYPTKVTRSKCADVCRMMMATILAKCDDSPVDIVERKPVDFKMVSGVGDVVKGLRSYVEKLDASIVDCCNLTHHYLLRRVNELETSQLRVGDLVVTRDFYGVDVFGIVREIDILGAIVQYQHPVYMDDDKSGYFWQDSLSKLKLVGSR